jgi:hypothetical protein
MQNDIVARIAPSVNTAPDFAGFLTAWTGVGALKRRIIFEHHESRGHFVGLRD